MPRGHESCQSSSIRRAACQPMLAPDLEALIRRVAPDSRCSNPPPRFPLSSFSGPSSRSAWTMRVALPRNAPGVVPYQANPKVGKFVFTEACREKRKVRTAAYLLMIVMVGLGGLEPPTSPLSGAFMVLYA